MANEYDPEFIAYVAGLFDGEGCLQAAMRHTNSVQVHMTISNIHRGVLEEIQQAFGGTINKQSGGVRQCWSWRLSTYGIQAVLPLLIPHLRIKRTQALVFLRLVDMQSKPYGARIRVTPEVREARISLLSELHQAKRDVA